MADDVTVGKEELSVQVDSPAGGVDGVDPSVLAAVIVGVLCGIALLFSMAVFMDRWRNRKLEAEGGGRGLATSVIRLPIMDDVSSNPISEPPALQVSNPGTSSEC